MNPPATPASVSARVPRLATHPASPPVEVLSVQVASGLGSTWGRGACTPGWWSSSAVTCDRWHGRRCWNSISQLGVAPSSPGPAWLASTLPCVAPSLYPQRSPLPPGLPRTSFSPLSTLETSSRLDCPWVSSSVSQVAPWHLHRACLVWCHHLKPQTACVFPVPPPTTLGAVLSLCGVSDMA